jgi:RNA polymerase sigma-70 factor (ECF subfamily)
MSAITRRPAALARARAGDDQAFRELTDPFRGELEIHCYRMLGSVQDAEDLVQETLLAAWRGLGGYEGRASLRSWLYRIATNRCLNALRDGARRPQELIMPSEAPAPSRVSEPIWLEPYPDHLLAARADDEAAAPAARYERREAIALAFVAGLQHLPPRQRAVLVLRDVLGFRAGEVAEMLAASEASVNSALQRARSALDQRLPAGARERAPLPHSARERAVAGRFADAFENGDIDGVVALLSDDARLSMPPRPEEYHGRTAIAGFLAWRVRERAGRPPRLVPMRANMQPAFGCYLRDPHAPLARAYALFVLGVEGDAVGAITVFTETALFARFGLPRTLSR